MKPVAIAVVPAKLRPKEAFRNFPVEERAERLRRQAGCGDRAAGSTTGWWPISPGARRVVRALEDYPMTTKEALADELHVGTVLMFEAAGLVPVSRPTTRRRVMRIDF